MSADVVTPAMSATARIAASVGTSRRDSTVSDTYAISARHCADEHGAALRREDRERDAGEQGQREQRDPARPRKAEQRQRGGERREGRSVRRRRCRTVSPNGRTRDTPLASMERAAGDVARAEDPLFVSGSPQRQLLRA